MDELDGRNFIQFFGGRCLKTASLRTDNRSFRIGLVELEQRVCPTSVDTFIKARFWRLACSAAATGLTSKKVPISGLYSEICSYTHFWANVINNPLKFAWILRQPFGLKQECELTISRLLDQMRVALERPLEDKDGRVSASEVRLFLKCFEMLLRIVRPEPNSCVDRTLPPERFTPVQYDKETLEKRIAELTSKFKGECGRRLKK